MYAIHPRDALTPGPGHAPHRYRRLSMTRRHPVTPPSPLRSTGASRRVCGALLRRASGSPRRGRIVGRPARSQPPAAQLASCLSTRHEGAAPYAMPTVRDAHCCASRPTVRGQTVRCDVRVQSQHICAHAAAAAARAQSVSASAHCVDVLCGRRPGHATHRLLCAMTYEWPFRESRPRERARPLGPLVAHGTQSTQGQMIVR